MQEENYSGSVDDLVADTSSGPPSVPPGQPSEPPVRLKTGQYECIDTDCAHLQELLIVFMGDLKSGQRYGFTDVSHALDRVQIYVDNEMFLYDVSGPKRPINTYDAVVRVAAYLNLDLSDIDFEDNIDPADDRLTIYAAAGALDRADLLEGESRYSHDSIRERIGRNNVSYVGASFRRSDRPLTRESLIDLIVGSPEKSPRPECVGLVSSLNDLASRYSGMKLPDVVAHSESFYESVHHRYSGWFRFGKKKKIAASIDHLLASLDRVARTDNVLAQVFFENAAYLYGSLSFKQVETTISQLERLSRVKGRETAVAQFRKTDEFIVRNRILEIK